MTFSATAWTAHWSFCCLGTGVSLSHYRVYRLSLNCDRLQGGSHLAQVCVRRFNTLRYLYCSLVGQISLAEEFLLR